MLATCRDLENAIKNGADSVFYIDRIDIRVGDVSIRNKIEKIITREKKNGVLHKAKFSPIQDQLHKNTPGPKLGQAQGFKVQLSRPRMELLRGLSDILVGSQYTMSWLEIAYDIDMTSRENALNLISLVGDMIVIKDISSDPTFMDMDGDITSNPRGPIMSAYFSHRDITGEGKKARKENVMFKIYVPEDGQKIFGSASYHSEFCISGTPTVRKCGFWSLQDLIGLNVQRWFNKNVGTYRINKQKLGRSIRLKEGKEVSGRQGKNIVDELSKSHRLIAHRVYHDKNPKMRDGLIGCNLPWPSGSLQYWKTT